MQQLEKTRRLVFGQWSRSASVSQLQLTGCCLRGDARLGWAYLTDKDRHNTSEHETGLYPKHSDALDVSSISGWGS